MILSMEVEFLAHLKSIMKVNGDKESNMEMDFLKVRSIITHMLESFSKGLKQVKVISSMEMVQYMQASS